MLAISVANQHHSLHESLPLEGGYLSQIDVTRHVPSILPSCESRSVLISGDDQMHPHSAAQLEGLYAKRSLLVNTGMAYLKSDVTATCSRIIVPQKALCHHFGAAPRSGCWNVGECFPTVLINPAHHGLDLCARAQLIQPAAPTPLHTTLNTRATRAQQADQCALPLHWLYKLPA